MVALNHNHLPKLSRYGVIDYGEEKLQYQGDENLEEVINALPCA